MLKIESIVGMFDMERGMGQLTTAEEFNAYAPPSVRGKLDDAAISRVRATRGELFKLWGAVATGDSLELEFPPTANGH